MTAGRPDLCRYNKLPEPSQDPKYHKPMKLSGCTLG